MLRDPVLYEFIDDKEPASENWLRRRFARLESRRSADGTEHWLNWVVRDAEGVAAGYVQATVYPGGEAEVAYVIGRDHWRKGLGSAAVAVMLEALLLDYGVVRATATLDPDNPASLALLAKLGFRFEAEDAEAHEVRYVLDLAGAT